MQIAVLILNNADKGAWSAQTGNEEYTYNATYSEIDGTATSEIATSSNALMLIPQNDLSSVKILLLIPRLMIMAKYLKEQKKPH